MSCLLATPLLQNGQLRSKINVSMRSVILVTGRIAGNYEVMSSGPEPESDRLYCRYRQVILGNHRDAWVFGAFDPNSGTAALMSIASALGTMRKSSESSVATGSWCG